MRRGGLLPIRLPVAATFCLAVCLVLAVSGHAQTANERAFPQSKAAIEKSLKELQPYTSGHLPTLDGFAVADDRAMDRFQRGYFQCNVQVTSKPSGGSVVRVSTKITAWYAGKAPEPSGYQVLASNGRLESDLLDRLAELLGNQAATSASSNAAVKSEPAKTQTAVSPPASAPAASMASEPDAPSKSMAGQAFKAAAPPPDAQAPSVATQRAVADRHLDALRTDAKNLEEILHNQSHPTNLVAVKKAGTPVLATPNEGAKVLFLASAEDEFEMLDLNNSWVHVRISGLSRGWIRRAGLELDGQSASGVSPAGAPAAPSATPASATPAKVANTERYVVEHEEIASFPSDWEALKGKTVKILTVQAALPTGGDAQAKLDFVKFMFNKEYAELAKTHTTAEGVVVIFDTADGGMLGTTLEVLRLWKAGTLSDEAMWRRCYVDPPEMVSSAIGQ
jgi:hypothetical protein